jgi:hypothetical protein
VLVAVQKLRFLPGVAASVAKQFAFEVSWQAELAEHQRKFRRLSTHSQEVRTQAQR